jgi:hypothetical protein
MQKPPYPISEIPEALLATERYPNVPGHRGVSTSIEAANGIQSHTKRLHSEVIRALNEIGNSTSYMIADYLNIDHCSIQPRTTELHKKGVIVVVSDEGRSPRGKKCRIWGLAS